jgi:hypothetical protein
MHGRSLATLSMIALFGAFFLGHSPARAAAGAVPEAAEQCLGCHSVEGLDKKLANGETLSLHVDGSAFAKSVHSMIGCTVCHADTTLENHPPLKKKIASVRENSLALAKVCRSCHADKFKLYEGSIHAALLREGNPVAPICTDCHSPHEVMAKAGFDIANGAPCSKCHGSIFEAYAGSVHGQARKQGRVGAPVCSSCHSAHDVKAAAGEDKLKENCYGCHQGALPAHQKWLPNAKLHLQTVSCPACHAPGVKRRVDLRLYDSTAQKRMVEKQGVPQFEMRARAIDTDEKGLNASQVRRLLQEFNNDGMQGKAVLRGRLEVDGEVEAHQLADKSKAVAQCESCHRAGSEPFQRVTISIAGPDGRPVRYAAHEEVLSSPISVESAGGFYVIGGTRIKLLDVLVVLALLAGIGIPVVHFTVKMLARKLAKRISGREDS